MRQYVAVNDCKLPGGLRRKIRKPTAFMMAAKFTSVLSIRRLSSVLTYRLNSTTLTAIFLHAMAQFDTRNLYGIR
ncbi:hypothetical protein JCM12296A_41190 [Desulfosarcina cetonica]